MSKRKSISEFGPSEPPLKKFMTLKTAQYRRYAKRQDVLLAMQKQIYRNRPEMKTNTISITGDVAASTGGTVSYPCRLGQGTSVQERIGNKIRVWRIEIRGQSSSDLDHYIIQKKTSTDPAQTDFGSTTGAYITDANRTTKFTEWGHYRNMTDTTQTIMPVKFSKRFKGGLLVKYNGSSSTSIVGNELVIFLLNRGGSLRTPSLSCRMWYTDA